jgi:DNA primase
MAKIKDEDIDLLRERADIVEVVSAYTQLKKSGGNTFKGLCPFHSEKTPSFSVDAARGLYHCFGCGEGGNIYHFIEKTESLSFPEAVEWLARKQGFELHFEEQRAGERRVQGMKLRIVEANEAAAQFFHDRLMTSQSAAGARSYLDSRGFGREVAARWELGYAPGGDALTQHLLAKKFPQEVLREADLSRRSERDGRLYDTFRQRLMFPTRSHQGDVVGFGGRILPGADGPKYLNSAATPAFNKSRVMYGLQRAKSTLARGNPAIVVEGYTDVIALHEAGIDQAVATNGVALGESHLELLKKFTQRLVLMFDADEAGKGATERGFDLQHKLGIEVLVAPLPSGSDPADVIAAGGVERVRKYVEEAQPLMEFKLEKTIEKLPLDTPEARGRAVGAVVEVLGWHPDPVARGEYAFLAARRIGIDAESIQRALAERRSGASALQGGTSNDRIRRLPGHVKVEREALQLLVTRGDEVNAHLEGIDERDFTSPPRRELFSAARAAVADGTRSLDGRDVGDLSPEARSLLSELVVAEAEDDEPEEPGRLREVFGRLRVLSLEREIKSRRATLQDVNPLTDPNRHDQLFTEFVRLEAERRDLLRRLREAP